MLCEFENCKQTGPEEWRPVADFPLYEVSNLGRVRSLDRAGEDSLGRLYRRPGQMMTLCVDDKGYLYLPMYNDTRKRPFTRKAHKLVCEAFHGPQPLGPTVFEVRHLDGNPGHACAANLAWGTKSENMQDKRIHGTNHQLNKTHCPRGHVLAGFNIKPVRARAGTRECLSCDRAKSRTYQQMSRAGRIEDYSANCPEVVALADENFEKLVLESVKTLVVAQHVLRRFLPVVQAELESAA